TLEQAFNKLETLEHTCKISFIARSLGNENTIPDRAVEKLFEIRERNGAMRPDARTGQVCSYTPGAPGDRETGRQGDKGTGGHISPINPISTENPEQITLTRAELVELLTESARLFQR
ncbi:MAG TPA: hypothetical protein VKE91_07610, partial [Blastocatellia bacterium]|nr:hypothetical protein [Blastocatellia bacterium]